MSGRKRRPNKQQATERAVKIQRCQGQTGLLESGIIRQGCQERERDISRIPRDDAVDSRDNQAVRPPFGNFHHPACPGLLLKPIRAQKMKRASTIISSTKTRVFASGYRFKVISPSFATDEHRTAVFQGSRIPFRFYGSASKKESPFSAPETEPQHVMLLEKASAYIKINHDKPMSKKRLKVMISYDIHE